MMNLFLLVFLLFIHLVDIVLIAKNIPLVKATFHSIESLRNKSLRLLENLLHVQHHKLQRVDQLLIGL